MAKPKTLPYDAAESETGYSVELHNTAGGSDKIYRIAIEPKDGQWVVNYANGRRGGTMATGTKTKDPVSYAEARKACNSLLYDKVGGGYVPIGGSRFGDGMTAEAIATVARESSGHVPQLLNAIEEDELEAFIRDDAWVAQFKFDGERRVVEVKDGAAGGGNRKGQSVALSGPIAKAAAGISKDVVLDGEQIGDVFHFFDVLSLDGQDLKGRRLDDRLKIMSAGGFERAPAIRMAETAVGAKAKRAMIERARAADGEGVVFKRLDSVYEPGRPNSKGDWRKFKFWKGLSAIVGETNAKRSVRLELIDESGGRISVGNVTIPPNAVVPEAGQVVEIRYLYAYEGGSLFQPQFHGVRNDIDVAECLASQRFFKPETPESDVDEEPAVGMRM